MSINNFKKALQVTVPKTLVAGTIKYILPNNRGQILLDTGPILNDVMLPEECVAGESVLLFRAPRDNAWRVVRSGTTSTIAVSSSNSQTTFVSPPEHIRWFSIQDKIVLSWYVWPAFEGVFEVQVAFSSDKSDALTWTITSGGMTIFDPGDSGIFYTRLRAVNKYFVSSDWTDWLTIDVDTDSGVDGRIAFWNGGKLDNSAKLLWKDGRMVVYDNTSDGYLSNMHHYGIPITYSSMSQTASMNIDADINSVYLAMAQAASYNIRFTLMAGTASLFTSDIPQINGVAEINTGGVHIAQTDALNIVLESIQPSEYPYMFYTRWNMYGDGEISFPGYESGSGIDMAFAISYTTITEDSFTAIDDGISFNDVWRIAPTASDITLSLYDNQVLHFMSHNHSSASCMGEQIAAADVVVDTGAFSGNLGILDSDIQHALETIDAMTAGGAVAFTDLSDTPSVYTDQAGKYVRVNTLESDLEFVTPTISGEVDILMIQVFT